MLRNAHKLNLQTVTTNAWTDKRTDINMNKLLLLIFLTPSIIFADKNDCGKLKEGTFKLIDNSVYTIVRTKDKQTENDARTGSVTEFDIKWLSECTYILFNRKVIKGADEDTEIDTLYNEIIEINGAHHKVRSTVKKLNMTLDAILTKIDTSLLYRNIYDLAKYKDYNGESHIGTLIDDNFAVQIRQHKNKKTKYVLAFEEVLSLNHKSKFLLIDAVTYTRESDQSTATHGCRFLDKYDNEIIALYSSESDDKEAKIHKAWRLNRKTLKIEPLDIEKVKYKVEDKNNFLLGR